MLFLVEADEPARTPIRPIGRLSAGQSAAAVLLTAILLALPPTSPAQAPADVGWVGKRVVQKNAGFHLRVENQLFGDHAKVWEARKAYDKAITDRSEAIRLKPDEPILYLNRAFTYMSADRPTAVSDDVKHHLDTARWGTEYSTYAVILGHLAALRSDRAEQARSILDQAASRCDHAEWPYPVLAYLRGEIDEPKLLAAATDTEKMTEVRCYLGLAAVQKGDKKTAEAHLRRVKDNRIRTFLEYKAAIAALDRLRDQPAAS
jgi:tetratricopeptide (TPR) repeat protein